MVSMKYIAFCVLLMFLAVSAGMNGQPNQSGFSNASLSGTFSAREEGDGSVSAGLGLVYYDGKGKTTRRIRVNAPGSNGDRRILIFESEGTYNVNPDGTGTVFYTTRVSGGPVTNDSFDFVITETENSWVPAAGVPRIGTELFAAQREAGVTVSLITSLQKRIVRN